MKIISSQPFYFVIKWDKNNKTAVKKKKYAFTVI